ncbi:pentatricopeptide repeat-containing protein At5g27460-like [Lolium rigidum]|uniref:pentatricopeptide repeat-containing protein At5g27460-like n=1 Tax=Lolium rigidum TaxID=89674 RepID=UPI001F5C6D16|nr:pentatricopeptide repeat-containing protein At5g27460-like [Lolium rigidum]
MAAAALARRRLLRLLASSPNRKALSLSSSPSPSFDAPATARQRDPEREGDLLSRRLLRLHSMGSVAAAIEGWAQMRGRVSRADLHRAVSQLRRARRYNHALEILSWMDSRKDIKLSPSDHAARLDLIGKVHGTSQAEEYYNQLQKPASREAASFPLLHCYVAERNVQKAENLMASLQSVGLPVDPHSFNEMLKLYVATCQYEKVHSVINLMKRNNIPRNALSYNLWMNACSVSGVASVQSAFNEMVNDGMVEVGWSAYCTLANIFRKHGLNSKALACLRTAETKLSRTQRLGYFFVMTCYAGLNDSDGVTRLWEASKCVPGRIPAANYMSAIISLIRVGDIDQAEWMFGSWELECWKYDVRVSNVLLGAYVRNGWIEKAEKLHLHVLEKGGHPNYKTWEILLEGFVESNQMDKAVNAMKKALSSMKSCRWRPPLKLVEAIAAFFEEQGNADDANRYIKVLQKFNLTSLPLYKSVLRTYIKADTVATDIAEMIARDQIVMDEEMDHLIIRASKIDTRCNV